MKMNKHEQVILQVLTQMGFKVNNEHELYEHWFDVCKNKYNEAQELYKEFSK